MKRTQKMLSLILAALILSAPVLSACSDETGETPAADTSAAPETTAEETTAAETEPPIPYDYLTKKNYDGRAFTIASPSSGTRYIPGQFLTAEESGDVIMDAAYQRNLNVSEELGVTIKHLMPADSSGFAAATPSAAESATPA